MANEDWIIHDNGEHAVKVPPVINAKEVKIFREAKTGILYAVYDGVARPIQVDVYGATHYGYLLVGDKDMQKSEGEDG